MEEREFSVFVSAEDYLKLVGGMVCPCGHAKDYHEKPSDSIPGETMGACTYVGCDCKGVIDCTDDDEG